MKKRAVLALLLLVSSCATIKEKGGAAIAKKWNKGFDISWSWLGLDWAFKKNKDGVKIDADKEF